jgi:hypothetical protein
MRRSGQFKPAGQDPRRGKGGARRGAGRLSREKKAIRIEVKRLVELELERHVMAVIGAGKKIATGVRRRKHNPKTGKVYYEIEYDGAMIRAWIDKFAPDAAKTLGINVNNGLEDFYQALALAEKDAALARAIEPETKVELLHDKKTNQ